MPTASIYVRLSKAATERNLSLPGMLDKCRALAAHLGFKDHRRALQQRTERRNPQPSPASTLWLTDGRGDGRRPRDLPRQQANA